MRNLFIQNPDLQSSNHIDEKYDGNISTMRFVQVTAQGQRLKRKQDPAFWCIQETHLTIKDRHHLSIKGWKEAFQGN